MKRWSSSPYFTHALLLTLVGSIFSNVVIVFQPSYASHAANITLDLSEINVKYDPGDDVTITGTIDDLSTEDQVNLDVNGPGTSDDDNLTLDEDEDDFAFNYPIDGGADDGIYTIEVEYDGDSAFAYFLIDEDSDEVTVETDSDSYQPGDTVEVSGQLEDPQSEDVVEITILGPTGNEVVNGDEENVDNNDEFSYDYDIDNDDDVHGLYAITVVYDNNQKGYTIFEVEEESIEPITGSLSKTSYKPGDTVTVTGDVGGVEPGDDVFIEIKDPDGVKVFDDDAPPETSGSFEFEYDLEDDAETGEYTVTIYYIQVDNDKVLKFTVSTSTSGGGTGSGSGSSGGLTAKLNKVKFLAGETMTITGVVPAIQADEPVAITIIAPDGIPSGTAFPEPESDKSYSASLRLKSSLEPDDDYKAVISYDNKEVTINFDITGVSTEGGPLTVKTDKTTYSSGSTVKITGQVSEELVGGLKVIIRAENPNDDVYRFDVVTPSSDGSYSYSMVLGGDLEVNGEWIVTAFYDEEEVETTFQLGSGTNGGGTSDGKLKYNLKIDDETYPIEYEVKSGSVEIEEMIINYIKKKLVISVNADEEGELILVLPREVIDAVEGNGSDIKYIVTTRDNAIGDDILVDVSESETDDETRTLVIDVEAGTDIIEIAGTTVVPEFGPLSAIMLAVAIVGVIAGTARFSRGSNLFRN